MPNLWSLTKTRGYFCHQSKVNYLLNEVFVKVNSINYVFAAKDIWNTLNPTEEKYVMICCLNI